MSHLANEPEWLTALKDPDAWASIEQLCNRAAAERSHPLRQATAGRAKEAPSLAP